MRLYHSPISGNSYKVLLLLSHLGRECEIVPVDILRGETRTPEFLKLNPNGRAPVLEDDGFLLSESNTILAYLARSSRYLPESRQDWALIFQWMFFEQYSHEPYIATSRFLLQHRSDSPERDAELARRREPGWTALRVMEDHVRIDARHLTARPEHHVPLTLDERDVRRVVYERAVIHFL